MRVVRNYRRAVERAWPRVLRRFGLPADACEDLLLLRVSLFRGFGIRHLRAPEPERVARLLPPSQQMIVTHVRARRRDLGPEAEVAAS